MIEKGFNQAGCGAFRLLSCAVCTGCLYLALSDSKIQLIWTCMESKGIILPNLQHNSSTNIMCSDFEMMPQKVHSLPQDLSHLANPFIGAHRSRGFSHPLANHSFLVCRLQSFPCGERPSLLPVSPFCGPAWVLSSVASSGVLR